MSTGTQSGQWNHIILRHHLTAERLGSYDRAAGGDRQLAFSLYEWNMEAAAAVMTTTAMVDFVTRVVGWKVDARYNALSLEVNRMWDRDDALRQGSTEQLRQAVAADPKLRVMIVHGWNDLSCPFMGSVLTVDQMPVMGDPTRVAVHEYPGGHMFYTRSSSGGELKKDVGAFMEKALK